MYNDAEDYDEDDNGAWGRREVARSKQIQIGKARPEYQRYLREVPVSRRRPSQPSTPDPKARVSKRQFDRALADWRRHLHEYDVVPRNPPRGEQSHCIDYHGGHNGKPAWGASRRHEHQQSACLDNVSVGLQSVGRFGSRRNRGVVAPRGERSTGKFGPRKRAEEECQDVSGDHVQVEAPQNLPPAPTPVYPGSTQPAAALQQNGAVPISLAGQLLEMPMSPAETAVLPTCPSWSWFGGSEWGNFETPHRNPIMWMNDMQYAQFECTPDKLLMPCHGDVNEVQDMSISKASDAYLNMPVETAMIPERLFDSSPEKSEQGHMLESSSMNSETTAFDSADSLRSPLSGVGEPASPRTATQPHEALSQATPRLPCLASPVPTKRPCYVAETPSPERMHCSWMNASTAFSQPSCSQPFVPWHLGSHTYEHQVIPEFMSMMSYTSGEA